MFDAKGIIGKLEDKADVIAAVASIYGRFNGNMTDIVKHYTNFKIQGDKGALGEAIQTISNPNLLRYKLWDANHAYTGIIRGSVYAYMAAEFGIIPSKWKTVAKKAGMAAAVAAITLPGSGEEFITHPIGSNSTGSNTPSLRAFYGGS